MFSKGLKKGIKSLTKTSKISNNFMKLNSYSKLKS